MNDGEEFLFAQRASKSHNQKCKLFKPANSSFNFTSSLLMNQTTPSQVSITPKIHKIVTPDGLNLYAQEWGNPKGPEIILIHGGFQSHLSWSRNYESDLAKHFRIIAYDFRGHGLSDKPSQPEFYVEGKRWADEVHAVIVQTDVKRPTLVGWSYAGRIISDYLSIYDDAGIAAINFVGAGTNVLLNANPPTLPALRKMMSDDLLTNLEGTRAFLRLCFSKQPHQDDFENMVGFNMLVSAEIRRHLLARSTTYEAVLRKVNVPVLITHGTEDQAVPLSVAKYTATTIPNSKSSFYEGIGHSPFWEDPERFNRELHALVMSSQ